MVEPSPRELFDFFLPDPKLPGKFPLYTETLRKNNAYTSWCHNLPQADRHCLRFRNTRRVSFSGALHSEEMALKIARERRRGARSSRIRGCAASATAMQALWAVIPYGPAPNGGGILLPPRRADALGVLEAVAHRASIIMSTRGEPQLDARPTAGSKNGVIYAIWLMRKPWLFDLQHSGGAEREAASALLGRVQGAVVRLAAERGWSLGAAGGGAAGDLGASFPLPGFATGASAQGPRAVVEVFPALPGDARYRWRDFESLPKPPPPDPQPWRAVLTPAASTARERKIFDFAPIADGCSWIRECRARRASLSEKQLKNAAGLLTWCKAPAADGRELVHELFRGHTGYDEAAVDRMLAGELRALADPTTCIKAGQQPGVVEQHCSRCPHFGLVKSPAELALPPGQRSSRPRQALSAATAGSGAVAPTAAQTPARTRIVITSDRHSVNDQALAVLAAKLELFELNGTLVEVVRYPGAAAAARRVSEPRLAELLSRHCEFVVVPGPGAEPRPVPPPRWTTRAILARGHWPELQRLSDRTANPSKPKPKEDPPMTIIDDLFDTHSPSRADLQELDRIGRHRCAFEKIIPAGAHQASVRNRLLSFLDDMEEMVCEQGHDAPALAEAWQRVDELEALFWESGEADANSDSPREGSRPTLVTAPTSLPSEAVTTARRHTGASHKPARTSEPAHHRKAA